MRKCRNTIPKKLAGDRLCWILVNLTQAVENYADNQVYEAYCFLENWHGCALIPPKVRRRNAEPHISWLVQDYPSGSDYEAMGEA